MSETKKHILGLVLLLFLLHSHNVFSDTPIDSLLKNRAELLQEYTEIISSPRAVDNTERLIFDLQNRIINIDDQLVNEHMAEIREQNQILAETLQDTQLSLQAATQRTEDARQKVISQRSMGQFIIVGLFLLAITLFVIIIRLAFKNKNYRQSGDNTAYYKDLLEKAEITVAELEGRLKTNTPLGKIDSSEQTKLQEKIQELEKQAGETHIKIISLKNEKNDLEEQLKKLSAQTTPLVQEGKEKQDDHERLILEHQLSEARAMLEDLTDKNKLISQELEKTIEAEKNLIGEVDALRDEMDEVKSQKQEIMKQLKIAQESLMASGKDKEEPVKIEKLNRKIEIYQEQLIAEEKARLNFENQVNEILKEYREYIKKL